MAMNDLTISDMQIIPLKESAFVKPFSISFIQNGKQKRWDCIKVHDSVVVVVFNVSRQVLVLVKQFRPAVYYSSIPEDDRKGGLIDTSKYPVSLGVTLEFCAGCIDKDKTPAEIAREEVLEECGYSVRAEDLVKFKSWRTEVNTEGAYQTMFYVEVTDEMKVSKGGGLVEEGEVIEVTEMSIPDARAYLDAPYSISPAGFLYGLQWFLINKAV